MLPDLIAVTAGREELSCRLQRFEVTIIGQHFCPQFVILPHTLVLSDPRYISKHSGKVVPDARYGFGEVRVATLITLTALSG
jgi:hypothetical protein